MTLFLLVAFAGMCFFLIGWGMWKPGRICEFPFLAGATFTGFILPQAVGIATSEARVPAGFDEAIVMSILCAAMCYLGYVLCNDIPLSVLHWQFDNDRLLVVGALLSAVGNFFFFLIAGLPDEMVATGGWTGMVIVYYFFAQVLRYGFALAVLLYAKLRSSWALAIILVNCPVLFDMIVRRGRRFYAIELVLVIVCTSWFVWRRTLPRWGMALVLAAGTLIVCGAATYRATLYRDQAYGGALRTEVPWQEILEIDFLDVFIKSNQEESYEFRNLAYSIHTTDTYDGGLSYWNDLVYIYVPAQLFGADFKQSLQFDLPGEVRDPASSLGTTVTGMADSYQAFGWYGCLLFFLFAYSMRKLFETAQAGNLPAQLAYMLIITSAMHTITHLTKSIVEPWPHMIVFILPCLLWARKPLAAETPETAVAGGARGVDGAGSQAAQP